MPNHVTNRISFRGDPEAIHRMLEAVKNEEEGYGSIDFNKILPMPRELNIESGSRTTEGIKLYNAFLEIYKLGKGQNVDLFSIPEESEKAFLKMRTDIDKKTWKLGKAACRNIQQFGCPTWYEWCNRHWGTKWNAYDFTGETDPITFHTAWSSPWPVMRELSRQYPDIEVTLSWADEDIGHNCGRYVYSGGNVTEEFIPADGRESYEFAAEVLREDLSDFGLVLNADETDYIWAGSQDYDVLELLGQRVLRSDLDLSLSDIPLGMYLYHLGTTDDRSRFNCICDHCPENFGCSIVTLQPIELGPDGERPLAEDEIPRFTTDKLSFEDLLQETITLNVGKIKSLSESLLVLPSFSTMNHNSYFITVYSGPCTGSECVGRLISQKYDLEEYNMIIQEYIISLSNGEKVIASEPYDLEGPKTVLNRFQKAFPATMFSVGGALNGFCYFKAKDIVSIRTGDVKEVSDGAWKQLSEPPVPKRESRQGSGKP